MHAGPWLLLLGALASGCDWPGKPNPADRPIPENRVLDFDALYRNSCAGCHGADGKLGPAPPLNDPLFLAIVPDTELLRVISEGRSVTPDQRTPMPAFAHDRGGSLTDEQVRVLAAGIKTRWGPPARPMGKVPEYVKPPSAGPGNRAAGAVAFARACEICHGKDGLGVKGKDGRRELRINDGPFLALISDQALRRYIITGRPDLRTPDDPGGMPDYAGARPDDPQFKPLTPQEVTDLVALLAYWRQGGSAEGP